MSIQEIITYSLVAAAVFFLGRHCYLILASKKKAGCADCGTTERK
jgi:hypothetical protein